MTRTLERSLVALSVLANIAPHFAAAQRLLPDFEDATQSAGVTMEHVYVEELHDPFRQIAGGVASGDVNGNGWPDLYVVGGDGARQYLFLNRGDGTYSEGAHAAGIDFSGQLISGPILADTDGDRDLDLFVGTVGFAVDKVPRLLINDGKGRFIDGSSERRTFPPGPYVGATFGDYDGDGYLDLFTSHWIMARDRSELEYLWRNEGGNVFRGATNNMGLEIAVDPDILGAAATMTFTGNFADIDNDGWPDLLVASDYGLSQAFRNLAGITFVDVSTPVISDENGMGATVGDYDNDGHLDWFVTSIFDPVGDPFGRWGATGNRLYRNTGAGSFEDTTEVSGVRDGAWGWGACFADFDNDGWLDIFHVNGWYATLVDQWVGTPARLFMNNRDGTFTESAQPAGIADRGEGRGVACFDFDRDGDIDVFIANITGPVKLYRNNLDGGGNFLHVKLVGAPPNTEAIGARISIESAGGLRQIRELRAGSNYLSQDPAVAHFGLDHESLVKEVSIRWPFGTRNTELQNVAANQHLVIFEVDSDSNCDGRVSASDLSSIARALQTGPTAAPCPGGDLNYDGVVDSADLQSVVSRLFANDVKVGTR